MWKRTAERAKTFRIYLICLLISAFLVPSCFAGHQMETPDYSLFDVLDGHLVYYIEEGTLLKNDGIGSFYFDEDGYYTSGDSELDASVREIVSEYTDFTMSREEKLRALYDFMVKKCGYRIGELHEKGETGWELDAAKQMIARDFRGNCYGFSSLFRELCREIGYPAECYSGTTKGKEQSHTPHGWVEIEIDGTNYIFDPEMEHINSIDMFQMPEDNPSTTRWGYDREIE